jgi:Arginase family
LHVGLATVNRDISYLRNKSIDNIKRYIDERLPGEYEKCLVGLNVILKEAWNTAKYRREPIGLIHLDAHVDAYGPVAGVKENAGSMFKIALEEGLIDPHRTIQIGIRGAMGDLRQDDWAHDAGYRIIEIEEFNDIEDIEKYKSLFPHVSAAIQLSSSRDGRYPTKGDTMTRKNTEK